MELLWGDVSAYRIIWQSAAIPYRVHAVRKNLPGEARTQLRDLLATRKRFWRGSPEARREVERLVELGREDVNRDWDRIEAFLSAPARELP